MDVPQRTNTKFPGNSPVTLGKRRAETDIDSSRLSASNIPRVPKFPKFLEGRQRVNLPVAPHFPVNPRSNQFSPTSRFPKDTHQISRRNFIYECDPWRGDEYQAILTEKKGGGVTIAHRQALSHPIIAVKEHECSDGQGIKNLVRCSHKNIVSLHEVYVDKERLFFMYECMDVSLAEIQATPYGEFAAFQIATICKEILNGIEFIHNELKIVYGSIDANSVMISRDGNVKLGNIGQSMLKGTPKSANQQSDYLSLGHLMIRLMERSTSLEDPDSLELRRPELWDQPIKDFLRETSRSSGETLQKNDFLDFSPESHWLKPLVLITERMAQRNWEPRLIKGKEAIS